MEAERLGFMTRLWMFFWLPFKVLFDSSAAWKVEQALTGGAAALPAPVAEKPVEKKPEPVAPPKPKVPDTAQALHLLAILQRDGRFVDFLQEDVAAATDDQVGAAARLVHEGCRKALAQYFTLQPVRNETEGSQINVPEGFDASQIRLTGNVTGKPPFRGTLAHPGWRAAEVKLPPPPEGQDPHVIAPAEVEL
jgi:hypothetical protein